ncbi:MAG: MFS transporter [Candidatus Omnitrophota bacterium]
METFLKTIPTRVFSSLKHRNFRLFWQGQLISLTGTWIQSMAQSWLVLALTNSAFLLGMINAISALPILLFSLVGGLVADHMNKRNLLILTQGLSMVFALLLGIMVSFKLANFWNIALIVSALGVVNAFDMPCRQSFVVEMVGKDDLDNAIALNSLIFNSARIIGPVVAGFLVSSFGVESCFYINGISFIGVLIGLLMMKGDFSVKKSLDTNMLPGLFDGARYVWSNKRIRSLIILVATTSIFGMSNIVLMPIFARDILMVGSRGLGVLMAFVGSGALCAGLTLAYVSQRRQRDLLVTIGGIVMSLSLICFSHSKVFIFSVAMLFMIGWGLIIQTASVNTILQISTPDNLRGRVMSFFVLMFLGMTPIGSFFVGLLAHWFGAPTAVALNGIACLLVIILLIRPLREKGDNGRNCNTA